MNEKLRANMGSVDAANKLKYEPDMGVDLTRKNGYVFNLNNYQTNKKKFVSVASYVIADSILRTEVSSECRCVLANGLYAEPRCKAIEQKLLPPVSYIELKPSISQIIINVIIQDYKKNTKGSLSESTVKKKLKI